MEEREQLLANLINDYIFYVSKKKEADASDVLAKIKELTGITELKELEELILKKSKSPNCYIQVTEYDMYTKKRETIIVNAKRIFYGYELTNTQTIDLLEQGMNINLIEFDDNYRYFKNIEEDEVVSVQYGMYLH